MRFGLQRTSLIDFPGRLACVVFLPGCNLRCPFCHNPTLVDPDMIRRTSEDRVGMGEIEAFLEKRRGVLEGVVLSGGEAAMHPEAVEIARKAKALGYAVKLDTNGLFPDAISAIAPDFIALDVKTSPGRYPAIPGAGPEAGAAILSSIDVIRVSGAAYEFRSTLVPGFLGMDELGEILGLLRPDEAYALQRFRPGDSLDPGFARVEAYPEAECQTMLARARESLPGARLR